MYRYTEVFTYKIYIITYIYLLSFYRFLRGFEHTFWAYPKSFHKPSATGTLHGVFRILSWKVLHTWARRILPSVQHLHSCGKIHHDYGKTHYFDWAMFNCYVSHYQRVSSLYLSISHKYANVCDVFSIEIITSNHLGEEIYARSDWIQICTYVYIYIYIHICISPTIGLLRFTYTNNHSYSLNSPRLSYL